MKQSTIALRLLQQQLQIVQIMTGDDDEWAFFYGQAHLGRLRMTEGFRVGLIQHRHALQTHFAHFQHDGLQFLHTPVMPIMFGTCDFSWYRYCARKMMEPVCASMDSMMARDSRR